MAPSSDPTALRSKVLALSALGVALVALGAATRFEAYAEVATTPVLRAWLARGGEGALDRYRPWRAAASAPFECVRQEAAAFSEFRPATEDCRRWLGPIGLSEHSESGAFRGSASASTVALDTLFLGVGPLTCELSNDHADPRDWPEADRREWHRHGELLYAHDASRHLHGYGCVATTGGIASVRWTLLVQAPDPWRSLAWWSSRPLVPPPRLAAMVMALAAAAVAGAWLLRERVFGLPWREAVRGADGVLRLGEVTVRAPGPDGDAAVCVVVPDGAETATYRSAAEVTATHHRGGTLDALRARRQRWRRGGVGAVVALSAASVAASAVLLAATLRG